MTTITATQARQDFFNIVTKSIKAHTPFKITSKSGEALLISAADYENLMETLELLSQKGFAKSIRQARADIKAGKTKSMQDIFGK